MSALAIHEQTNLPMQSGDVTPTAMLAIAVQQNADLTKLEKLMDLERQWKADRAREAYYQALAEFKKVPIRVTKDKVNKQYNSRYAGIGNMVNTVNAAMAPYGLNARWEFRQGDVITVTCILSHTLGHSESVSLNGVPDTSGSKNALQQIKSTITYLESATFQGVTGVVASDEDDDDGNGATGKTISEGQIADLEALMEEVKADKAAFLRWAKVNSVSEIHVNAFAGCVQALRQKAKVKK